MSGEAEQVRQMTGKRLFDLGSCKSALIIIDMQNAFLEKGAAFEVPKGRDVIPNIEKLLTVFRNNGMPVVWTQSDHSPPYGGLILRKYPIIRDNKVLWKGEPSFQLYSGMLQPLNGEHRVVKHKYDAFYQTDLEMILRNLSVDTVIITGVDTCVCCESTAREAFFRDFNVSFVKDGTASYDDGYHSHTLKVIDDIFGRVMSTDEVLAELAS